MQQLQVIGSQVSILGPVGLGVNGTGLRVAALPNRLMAYGLAHRGRGEA